MPAASPIADRSRLKGAVRDWWNGRPCGIAVSREPIGSRTFFDDVTRHRYLQEPHIPEVARFGDWAGQHVLEIGCGLGTDLTQFARAGARCVGIDLTPRAVELCERHFAVHRLSGRFSVGDAENLAFGDQTFDLVYSHGVLHHTPDTERAIDEVHRVLKPGGTAIVMLYHRHSFNYWVNIRVVRRLGLSAMRTVAGRRLVRALVGSARPEVAEYERIARDGAVQGVQQLLNQNTDGPGNPLSRVFSRREARHAFRRFSVVRLETHWLVKKNLPVLGRLVPPVIDYWAGRFVGWDLYVIARK